MNYYELLGVTFESTENEILKAYRKKALLCHPDKNPDNPKAAELFIEIAEALKILTDPKAREALNKVIKAKEAAKLRTKAFDAKRKKFKDDLEHRENAAQEAKSNDALNAERLAAEIKRLREEGSRLLKEQQVLVEKQLNEDRKKKQEETSPKLKVKWTASVKDHQNGGYNEEVLMQFFEKYGPVSAIVLSSKNGLAIVEFKHHIHANMALEFEKGLEENPFVCSWLEGAKLGKTSQSKVPSSQMEGTGGLLKDSDFESIVLSKLRQAEERKRLTQKILEEDKDAAS